MSRKEIEEIFADGWMVESIKPSRNEVPPDPNDISFSDGGPTAWYVAARRACNENVYYLILAKGCFTEQ